MKRMVLFATLVVLNTAFASSFIPKKCEPKEVEPPSHCELPPPCPPPPPPPCPPPPCPKVCASKGFGVYIGPHFNYTRIYFENPSFLQGYEGGLTAGIQMHSKCVRSTIDFEATWNAGPITGDPCQRATTKEYFLELQLGWVCSCNCCTFDTYSGFGWDQYTLTQNPNTAALRYFYNKLFVPFGIIVDCSAVKNVNLGLQLEFRPDIYSHLELVGVDLQPKWGYGFRVQTPITQKFRVCGQKGTLSFVPFFDWNRFGKVVIKNSVGAKLEIPRLIRWDLGLRMLVGTKW